MGSPASGANFGEGTQITARVRFRVRVRVAVRVRVTVRVRGSVNNGT